MLSLSIIVPVYNVESYLRKCVDSLLMQELPKDDYEIILVDDGSTDNSGRIVDEYAAAHSNIHVIHQSNAGLSEARNTGINAAHGEYLMFVDSDDFLESNVLGKLISQCECEQLDVLRFDYQNVRLDNGEYTVFQPNKFPHQLDKCTDVVDGETYLNERMGYACYACQFVIHHDQTSPFMSGIYFEDTEWTPRMLLKAKRVNATDMLVYNYLIREESITQNKTFQHIKKKNNSLFKVNQSLMKLLPIVNDGRWLYGCIADNVCCILNNTAAYDYAAVNAWISKLKSDGMFPLRGYNVRRMTMLRYFLINLSPKLYCFLRRIRLNMLNR